MVSLVGKLGASSVPFVSFVPEVPSVPFVSEVSEEADSGVTVRRLPIRLPESRINFLVTAISPAFFGMRPSCKYGWSMPFVPISCMVADLRPSKSNVTSCDRSACTFATPFTLRNAAISPFDRPAVDSTWTSCRPCASKKRSVLRNASRQPA